MGYKDFLGVHLVSSFFNYPAIVVTMTDLDTKLWAVFVFLICSSAPLSLAHAEIQTLEQSLGMAYEKNPGLMAERAKLRATDEQVSSALSGYRPTIDAIAQGGRQTGYVSGDGYYAGASKLNPHSMSIEATEHLFDGFKTPATVDSAESSVKAGRAALQDAEQQLLLDASKAYLDVVQATENLKLNRENEQVLQKQLDITKDRFQIGELKRTDMDQARSRLKAAMVSRLQAEGDLANQRATFARLVGDMPGSLEIPKVALENPKTQDEAVVMALHNNPAIIAASHTYDAAKSDITAAKGSLWPQVDLVASSTRGWDQSTTITDRQNTSTIMARVTIPLYHAGTDYAKTRAMQQTSTQRRMELEYARHKAREQALNAWQALQTARSSIQGRKEVVEATAAALDGVEIESKVGTRTTLDVLNAQQELLEAKINYIKAQHDETYAIMQVKSAIGELTAAALHLPVAPYDQKKNYDEVHDSWIGFADVEEN
jgi:TolC family type I secretion outer membrane protein